MQDKKLWQSKTARAAALLPLLTVIPGVKDVVASHPQESVGAISLLMLGLRLLTNGKVSL